MENELMTGAAIRGMLRSMAAGIELQRAFEEETADSDFLDSFSDCPEELETA